MGSGRGWLAGDWPSTGTFSTLLRWPGVRASSDGVLATISERKMLASTCLYSLYAWFIHFNESRIKIHNEMNKNYETRKQSMKQAMFSANNV